MIWRIPGISLNLHYPKEDDGELYTACPIIKGSRGIEPLNPLPQRRIRLTLPAYLCLKTALRRSEIREYYTALEMDLVCNSIPAADNDSIAMAFAGAFTGTMWDAGHGNVAGDHVSGGHRFRGYRCKRNTGAFTWTNADGARFHYQYYSAALDKAATDGGMGFGQEMMIHLGKDVRTTRPLGNINQFRALCLNHEGHIAVMESHGKVTFGNFIKALLDVGVTEALYTDMGPGWNYCFYRQQQGLPTSFLHNVPQSRASNFVVFKLK